MVSVSLNRTKRYYSSVFSSRLCPYTSQMIFKIFMCKASFGCSGKFYQELSILSFAGKAPEWKR